MGAGPTTASAPVSINERLLVVAVAHFGERGLEGASTREIARAAGTVMSSITYHFGGKHGLYLAAAAFVADRIREGLEPVFATAPPPHAFDAAGAAEEVARLADTVIPFMLHPDSAVLVRFVLREQMNATDAFDIIRERLVGPMAARLTALVARAGGEGRWSDEEVRIKTVAIFGQFLVFRIAHATVLAVTGWDAVTPSRTRAIVSVVKSHIRTILLEKDAR